MATVLREEKIEDMIDIVYKMMNMMHDHTIDECKYMLAALINVLVMHESDMVYREKLLKDLIDIVRQSMYDQTGEVYVNKTIED
jgi:hypothetical protein